MSTERISADQLRIHPDWYTVDRGLAYNRFTLEVYSCSESEMDILEAVRNDGRTLDVNACRDMIDRGFLTTEDNPESKLAEFEEKAKSASDVRISRLRFFVTERCNMGCPGCFVRFKYRNDQDFENSDKQQAERAVDFLREENEGSEFTIQFLGGEPLIGLELIEHTIDYAREVCEETDPNFSLTTNATLVTDEIAEYLDSEDVSVGVSFDGWKDINDDSRVYMDGEGTYDDAVEGFRTLKEHMSDGVGILVTPQPGNIDQLAEIVEHLIEELDPDGVTVNDPFHSDGTWEVDGHEFAEKVKRILFICEENKTPLISPASQIIKAFSQRTPKVQTITRPGRTYPAAMSVDGRISYHIMNYDEELFPNQIDEWSEERFEKWATFSGYQHEECRGCPAINTCGGPDPIESYQGNKDIDDIQLNPERCKFYKEMTPWILEQIS